MPVVDERVEVSVGQLAEAVVILELGSVLEEVETGGRGRPSDEVRNMVG